MGSKQNEDEFSIKKDLFCFISHYTMIDFKVLDKQILTQNDIRV